MLSRGWLIAFTLFFSAHSFGQTGEQYLHMADSIYSAGNKDQAKQLYLKAASMNNAEAHFAIAYKFVVTREESIYHFSEAAKMGHEGALEYVLDALLFRANSLTDANPESAYEIYKTAKAKNPFIQLFNEKSEVDVIKKCIEAGPLDANTFIKKYKITEEELKAPYGIWELAAEASRVGRFGSSNLKLTLQLIARGGEVPSEFIYAVDTAYTCWKNNLHFEFNVCDYVSSGYGLSYCSAKFEKENEKKNLVRIKQLAVKLNIADSILMNSFWIAGKYFEEKAWKEELHGGSGYASWTRSSIDEQKTSWLDVLERINNPVNLDSVKSIGDSDKVLNRVYRLVLDTLIKNPIQDINAEISADGLKSVQRLWIKYRDDSSKLFSQIVPSVDVQAWKNWMTAIRIHELNDILVKYE